MEDHDFSHQELGVFYTCGLPYKDYAKVMARKFEEERENYLGACYCRGFDTYGLLKK